MSVGGRILMEGSHRQGRLAARIGLLALLAFTASALGSEVRRSEGSIGAGRDWMTPYTIIDSGRAGPTVMVVGGVHGDEPAGAAAAEQIRHWPIVRGRLIVIPRANPRALAADSRLTPGVEKDAANLNRNFPSTRPGDEPRGGHADDLWRFVRQQRPTWLLDLHEGFAASQTNPNSVGSSIIIQPSDEALAASTLMLEAVNATIAEKDKHFVQRRSPIGGSLARAAAVQLGARTMILETTRTGQPLSTRVRQHRIMVDRFLRHVDMLADSLAPDRLVPADRPAGQVFVALYDGDGSAGKGVPRVLEILGALPDVRVERVGPADIRAGVLDQFDVVMFTGGTGSGQAKALEDAGRAAVRRFVGSGGGYVGICAGAYLACSGFDWGLGILDAKTRSSLWRRGTGTVKLAVSGDAILGLGMGEFDVRYANGPILEPARDEKIPDYVTLATFGTELAENDTPKGIMVGSPAAVAGDFGRGRVLCFSPHPEQSPGLDRAVIQAVRWAAAPRGAARSPDPAGGRRTGGP
ncbi:MAG: hypothetical protein AMXMBFR83_23790 [Phycisphaerae bacterium]